MGKTFSIVFTSGCLSRPAARGGGAESALETPRCSSRRPAPNSLFDAQRDGCRWQGCAWPIGKAQSPPTSPDVLLVAPSVQYQAVKAKDFVVTLDYGIAEVARLFERRQPSGRGFDCAFVRFHVAPLKLRSPRETATLAP